jgi:hypothetical protein
VLDELTKFIPSRPRASIERAIDGFSISPANLKADQRVVWNPKQESRAYRRGFFVFPHETGPHLAFSREMAKESLMQLVFWVCFKRLPVEWRTPETLKALDGLSHAASEWFEGVVCRNLQSLGIVGQRMHRTIGNGNYQMQIPDAVGEIDFLGYPPDLACSPLNHLNAHSRKALLALLLLVPAQSIATMTFFWWPETVAGDPLV